MRAFADGVVFVGPDDLQDVSVLLGSGSCTVSKITSGERPEWPLGPPPYSGPMEKMVVYATNGHRPVAGRGFLASVLTGIASILGLVLFLGLLVLIVGIFLAAVLVALVALGVHRALMVISPGYRDRRVAQGTFRPTTKVIDTTAKLIDSTRPKRGN